MSREQRVIDTFVELTDTLVADFDADELLQMLAARCVELLDVEAAGVMVGMDPGQLHAVAASGRDMRQLEIFEVASEEGPSYEAFASGQPVVVYKLADLESRWPAFVPRARDLGFRAAYGFPLRLRGRTIGALNLFLSTGRRLGGADERLAQGFADAAAIALIQERSTQDAATRAEQLSYALGARVVVEQAKGILAERRGLPPFAAFELLRAHARSHNHKMRDVAQAIIDGRLDLS